VLFRSDRTDSFAECQEFSPVTYPSTRKASPDENLFKHLQNEKREECIIFPPSCSSSSSMVEDDLDMAAPSPFRRYLSDFQQPPGRTPLKGSCLNFDKTPMPPQLPPMSSSVDLIENCDTTWGIQRGKQLMRHNSDPSRVLPHSPADQRCHSQNDICVSSAPRANPFSTPLGARSSHTCGDKDDDWMRSEAASSSDLLAFAQLFEEETALCASKSCLTRGIFFSSSSAFGQKFPFSK